MKINVYSFRFNYILCLIMLFVIQVAFGHSLVFYTTLMIVVMIITYVDFFMYTGRIDHKGELVGPYYLLGISILLGLFHTSIQDAPMAGVSIILPFIFSKMEIDHTTTERTFWLITAIGFIIFYLRRYINVLAVMNPNSLSFLLYLSLSSVLILFQYKRSLTRFALLIAYIYIIIICGSRNVFIITVATVVLSMVPYSIFKKRVFFRLCYIIALGYQIFSLVFMEYSLDNSWFSYIFEKYVQNFFNKSWGIESRVNTLTRVSDSLWNQSLIRILFGNGIAFRHAHNGFYQMTYMYGLIGSAVFFFIYIVMFEKAYCIILNEKNPLILGCVIALFGTFLIQGADVFLVGVKTCSFIPFFFMGTIYSEFQRIKSREVGGNVIQKV